MLMMSIEPQLKYAVCTDSGIVDAPPVDTRICRISRSQYEEAVMSISFTSTHCAVSPQLTLDSVGAITLPRSVLSNKGCSL
jgi:hypothetical protein